MGRFFKIYSFNNSKIFFFWYKSKKKSSNIFGTNHNKPNWLKSLRAILGYIYDIYVSEIQLFEYESDLRSNEHHLTSRENKAWKTCRPIRELSVIVWESVPGAKTCGQPIWLKLGTEVGCHEIFQKPIWLTSLTLSSRVSGGISFFAPWVQKIQPFRGHFESAIKPNW